MADAVEELKQVWLFSCLNDRQLKRLARLFKKREFDPATAIVRQGQMSGVSFFVIREGEASVTVDGTQFSRLGPGDHFGELSLISGKVRAATVTAEMPMSCLVMPSWDFRRFVKDNPDVSWKLLQHLANLVSGDEEGVGPDSPKR